MKPELRRSQRYADFLPISVTARKDEGGSQVAGPFSARIVDLSTHGACLLMTQVMLHTFHIFHSTRDDDLTNLVLQIKIPSQTDPVEILAQPIWLNSAKLDDIKVFKMGVDFIHRIDEELLRSINKMINRI
jgi:hypothetical protein